MFILKYLHVWTTVPSHTVSSREKTEIEIHEWPEEGSNAPSLRLVRRKLPHRKKTTKKELALTSGRGWLLLFSNHLLVNG